MLELLGGQRVYILDKNEWTVKFADDANKQKYDEIMDQYDILGDELSKRTPYKNAVKDMTDGLKRDKQHSM